MLIPPESTLLPHPASMAAAATPRSARLAMRRVALCVVISIPAEPAPYLAAVAGRSARVCLRARLACPAVLQVVILLRRGDDLEDGRPGRDPQRSGHEPTRVAVLGDGEEDV